jgi:hypothetical protein
MVMRKRVSSDSLLGCSMPEGYENAMKEQVRGHEPDPGRQAPGPTRTTSHPYAETNQRKPYLPTEDTSTPALDDGVSFRQSIY